ncbi:DUF4169 family protein [Oceanibacterium hippocampi]|uniref:Uncharacterized protein n=1 Tax=Oceanibacterium hippocampi TaxID=745714 RepID=A0A1Y5TR56_9PROT|nr:DUF4169 family protein [Oceanibacterium hippocampi]SLN70189.1 hypothetical protein OCH7691_03258 [Oceanibacterium hippocampi]
MGDIVNLNKYRKARVRAEAQSRAEENRRRTGLTKAEKDRERQARTKAERTLEGKKLDGEQDDPPKKGA